MRIIEETGKAMGTNSNSFSLPPKIAKYLNNYGDLYIDDEKIARSYCGYYCGFAGITFEKDLNGVQYVLNGTGDTWFRRVQGIGKGYGLLLQSLKPIRLLKNSVGDFNFWQAKISYVPFDSSESSEWKSLSVESHAYIYVNKAFELQDVVNYFNTHKNSYKP